MMSIDTSQGKMLTAEQEEYVIWLFRKIVADDRLVASILKAWKVDG